MSTYVLKYGGTSVGSIDKIKAIAKKLVDRHKAGDDLVVVVSAMGKSTDELISKAYKITEDPCTRDLDVLMATGEQVTIALLSMAIKELGEDSIALTGFQAGIETDTKHTQARISTVKTEKIESGLADGKIVVVAGFQGINEHGDITTLGRGGSDTSAVSIAATLECPCEIYTDVDGIYTIDPRLSSKAKKLKTITYQEMMELASRGAKVLETRSVELAHKYRVPLYVGEAHSDEKSGTYIMEWSEDMESKVVTGIAVEESCLMVSLNLVPYGPSNIASIFEKIASANINIDMISQTAPYDSFVNISFSSYESEKHKIKDIIESLKEEMPTIDYIIDDSIVKLSVVGIGMVSQSGVAADLFNILSSNNIEFYQVTTSEISISYTINHYDKERAVALISNRFNM
jgi:aspartate kinase